MRILLAITTLFVLLLSACSGPERHALLQADALMEEYPDSALSILQTIDRSHVSDRDLPYYALLMTQAQVKTDVLLDSDSLISIAYGRYVGAWRGDKGIRSSFYMGEVFFNQERPREAMRHYLSTYEDSKRLGNDYWQAKSAERIADLFFNAYNYPEAARYRKEAIECFGNAGRVTNQRYAIADLATDYMNDSRFDEAVALLDSVCGIIERDIPQDSSLLQYVRRSRLSAMVAMGRTEEFTEEDLSIIENRTGIPEELDNKILKLHIDKYTNNDPMKQNLFKDILASAHTDEDRALALYACYEQIRLDAADTFENALMDSLLFYQNAVAENIIKESTLGAERDFYADMAIATQQESSRHRFIALALLLLGAIAAFFISRFLRLRNKALKSELEANVESLLYMKAYSDKIAAEKASLIVKINERSTLLTDLRKKIDFQERVISNLNQDAQHHNQQIEDLRNKQAEAIRTIDMMTEKLSQEADRHLMIVQGLQEELERKNESGAVIENLFKRQWSTLNSLCVEYFEKGTLPKFHDIILRDIESEVRKIGSKDGLIQIEEEVNQYMDGIATKLRTECTKLSDNDIAFCCLIFTGFSVKAICFILDITSNNFYVRKKRVIKKISDSEALHKSLFLERL